MPPAVVQVGGELAKGRGQTGAGRRCVIMKWCGGRAHRSTAVVGRCGVHLFGVTRRLKGMDLRFNNAA